MVSTPRVTSGGQEGSIETKWAALFGSIILLGILFRFWRIGHGLPDFLEEALPLRRALLMWDSGQGQNPHFFNYPSLTLYLNEFLVVLYAKAGSVMGHFSTKADAWFYLKNNPTPVVIMSRSVNILADLATMFGVWRISRPKGHAATLVALVIVGFSSTMLSQSRLIVVEPVMTAFLVWCLERLIRYHQDRRLRFLIQAVVLGGLAAGTKYNAGLIVFPFLLLMIRHHRWKAAVWVPATMVGCMAVFLATSPFLFLDFSAFLKDFLFEVRHMSEGHLGTVGSHGALFVLRILARDLMYIGIPLLLFWMAATVKKLSAKDVSDSLILALLIPLLISTMTFKMEAARYLVPVIPLVALGVGGAVGSWLHAEKRRNYGKPFGLILAVFVFMGIVFGGQIAREGAQSTQIQARVWIENNIAPVSLIVQEEYGPVLFTRTQKRKILNHALSREVKPEVLQEFKERPTFQSIIQPLAVSGNMSILDPASGIRHPLFSHVSDFSGCFYSPELFSGTDYFITSSGVSQRYKNDPLRYPDQVKFYSWLESDGNLIKVFSHDGSTTGPEIKIYSLPQNESNREYGRKRSGRPWWASTISEDFLEAIGQGPGSFDRATFVENLAPFFQSKIMPFLLEMARAGYERKKFQTTVWFADQVLEVVPDQQAACALYCRAQLVLGHQQQALDAVEKSIRFASQDRAGANIGRLRVERANIFRRMGRNVDASRELKAIIAQHPADKELQRIAGKMLRGLSRSQR